MSRGVDHWRDWYDGFTPVTQPQIDERVLQHKEQEHSCNLQISSSRDKSFPIFTPSPFAILDSKKKCSASAISEWHPKAELASPRSDVMVVITRVIIRSAVTRLALTEIVDVGECNSWVVTIDVASLVATDSQY